MTEAAQQLHLTQSGVSQHMRAFEDSLGVRLFDRVSRFAAYTPDEEQQVAAGITPDMVRISVGLETLDDILWDLDQALAESQS